MSDKTPWMNWGPPVKTKNPFTNILNRGAIAGRFPGMAKESIEWFRNTARNFRTLSKEQLRETLANDRSIFKTSIVPGSMYMFMYDAKHKDTLPYFDAFPVIFPLELYKDGFLGLNFHYLQPKLRAVLMDSLYGIISDPKLTEKAKIRLSYRLLGTISQHKLFKPCIKRYLYSHFKSRYLYVEPRAWEIALFLPTENFQGASTSRVWADSRKKINGV